MPEVRQWPRCVTTAPSPSTYTLLDAGRGERLEQWGPYRLRRPDPRATMGRAMPASAWEQVDARYTGEAGRGRWEQLTDGLPERWTITHGGVELVVRLAPYKHTGVFPEQAEHWHWMSQVTAAARAGRTLSVLNLFAYTGGATMALARAGCRVTHVDASKPAIAWARENAAANGLAADAVRWIQDDAATFVRRERRRGRRYHAALMDPPAFGRTPDGRIWKLTDQFADLLRDVVSLLDEPVFLLVNDYSRDADPTTLAHLVESALARRRGVEAGHLHLRTTNGRELDTGAFVRWKAAD
jgi:23S rRNA (cytosine1962-C5)-methyltransferase